MNYIEQINMFWILDAEYSFNGNETRLYMYLLHKSNSLFWKNPLTNADGYTAEIVGIAVNTLKSVRNRLQQAGLITFKPGGNGARNKCSYYILPAKDVLKNFNKVSTIDTLSYKSLTPYLLPGVDFPDDISKQKLKQNKTASGANDDLPIPQNVSRKEIRKKKIEAFVPPTLEQAEAYFLDQTKTFWTVEQSKDAAAEFFNHYEANGWVQNRGKPIVKWEAAAQKWIRTERAGTFKHTLPSSNGHAPAVVNGTKTDELLKQDIEHFFIAYKEQNLKAIRFERKHYELLKNLGLTKLTNEMWQAIRSKAIENRMQQLSATKNNSFSDGDLLIAYQKGEPSELLNKDKENLDWMCRKLAIVHLFIERINKPTFFETV